MTTIALTFVLAILLCLAQTASAVAAKSPEKTASGIFFADPNIYTGEIAPESLQPQWEIAPTATPTASGRRVWLSADPIGEAGGMNLYGYMGGDPINGWDPLGLEGCPPPYQGEGQGDYLKRVAPVPEGFWAKLFSFNDYENAVRNWHRYNGKEDKYASYQKGLNVGADLGALAAGGFLHSPASPNSTPYPGNDPTKAPLGTVWKGQPGSCPGSSQGNYYNPMTGESYRPDLNHGPPIGPHWDFRDEIGDWFRLFPDGSKVPKPKR